MNSDETTAYWDQRHRRFSPLSSGGVVGIDAGANEIFYAMRLGRLLDLVGDGSEVRAPLRILDAGCGKGWFARAMARFGHRVDGIDISQAAIEECRAQATGQDEYAVCPLADWRPPYLYDVVYSVDVLFHVMDDDAWAASVRNLASLVRLGGRLILSDHGNENDRTWSTYQRTRGLPRYRALIDSMGYGADHFVPYGFRNTPVGFLVFDRVS
jgi:2-polyprenyl-3-methyl-5-hydroxy-6-metoxy-1,4-benzoquinol methylase